MSGEGPSSQAGRKRRGPQPRPRGDPEETVHVDRSWKVKYRGPGVPYGRTTRMNESPLLQFELESDEYRRLDSMLNVDLLPYRRINWDLMERLGAKERVEELLGDDFRWVLDCPKPQYKDITLEFHTTFDYTIGDWDEDDAVFFALGRQSHRMTVPQFAVATQFYSEEEVQTEGFVTALRGVSKKRKQYWVQAEELERFWGTISTMPYSHNLVASDISDPILRFIHKILAATLVGRGQGDNKVNQLSLFCLMCMVERRPANLATIFALSMKRLWRGGQGAKIYCGPYVTWLAESLGVFDTYPAERMRQGPAPCFMLEKDLQASGILTYTHPSEWAPIQQGPQVPPPAGSEAAETMQRAIPLRYQVQRTRHEIPAVQHPLRQPRPDPLTMESLYDRMDTGFGEMRGYVDEQIGGVRQVMMDSSRRHEEGQRRIEEGMRFMMEGLHLGFPPYWQQQPDQPGPSGGMDVDSDPDS